MWPMPALLVTTNLIDLRAKPDHHSERVDQAFFGAVLHPGKRQKGFIHVSKPDGYAGWVDERLVERIGESGPVTTPRFRPYVVIARAGVRILDPARSRTVAPHHLFYGTIVPATRRRGSRRIVVLPGGREVAVRASALIKVERPRSRNSIIRRLIVESRFWLGVPYLWGGISPCGCDCSGFVQTLFGRFGTALPRDTKDQISAGTAVTQDQTAPGDLLFFTRHVGIVVGRNRYIHATRAGGGVRVNSLDRRQPDYREDLATDVVAIRRMI